MVESQIQEAMEAGAFDNLPGAGQPLPANKHEQLAGNNWLGFKVLQNGGMLPEWLSLAREIEEDGKVLARIEARFTDLVAGAAITGDWELVRPGLRHALAQYEESARALRRKQDRFNITAPAIRCERPAIWVEFHLRRMRESAVAAGADEAIVGGLVAE